MTMTSSGIDTTYNGWKNYETWNTALYINNEYGFYQAACDYVRYSRDIESEPNYTGFILTHRYLLGTVTPDGVNWLDDSLDYVELTEMMNELVD